MTVKDQIISICKKMLFQAALVKHGTMITVTQLKSHATSFVVSWSILLYIMNMGLHKKLQSSTILPLYFEIYAGYAFASGSPSKWCYWSTNVYYHTWPKTACQLFKFLVGINYIWERTSYAVPRKTTMMHSIRTFEVSGPIGWHLLLKVLGRSLAYVFKLNFLVINIFKNYVF